MARLPQPGGDTGTWGDILNDYLLQSLQADGKLKPSIVSSSNLQNSSVTGSKLSASGASDGKVLVYDSATGGSIKWDVVSSGSSSPVGPAGGDLGGTYPNPTVPGLTAKEPSITGGTTAQYWRGDKSFQTLNQDAVPDGTTNKAFTATEKTKLAAITGTNTGDQDLSGLVPKTTTVNGHALSGNVTVSATDVGLGNVDNTSDATKNAATVSLTNKNLTSGTNTFPTFNQNTTGTASNVTGTVLIANGGTGQTTATAATNALLPSQTTNGGKYLTTDGTNTSWGTVASGGDASTNTATSVDSEAVLFSGTSGKLLKRSTLTGIVKQTSGVSSVAVAGDFPTLNQNTTGSAASLTTPRNINGVAFDGTANITVVDATKYPNTTTLDAIVAPAANVSLNSHKLVSVTDPSVAQDAATKNYVDTTHFEAQPSWHGMTAWTFDPTVPNTGTIPVSGTLSLAKLWTPAAINVTKIWTWVGTAGATLTNVGFGLWSSGGTLLTSTVNSGGATTTAFQSTGGKPVTVSSTAFAAGDSFYVGFWFTTSAGTIPAIFRATNSFIYNVNLTAPNLRFACADTGLTTTAPSTLGTQTSTGAAAFWAAVS